MLAWQQRSTDTSPFCGFAPNGSCSEALCAQLKITRAGVLAGVKARVQLHIRPILKYPPIIDSDSAKDEVSLVRLRDTQQRLRHRSLFVADTHTKGLQR